VTVVPAGPGVAGRRLDDAVAALAGVSRAAVAEWIADGRVQVDGKRRPKSWRLRGGEALTWEVPDLEAAGLPQPEPIPLNVRFEDEHLLVVAKAPGVVVHPAPGHPTGTLVNALLARGGTLSSLGGNDRPGIVHRLDKNTSGLLLVAKDDATHQALSRDLAARQIERRYLALAQGHLTRPTGTVTAPIGRHARDRKRMTVVSDGRYAVTSWKVLEEHPSVSYLEARLETGRTHQVRVHLAFLRHPLVGDRVYGADPRLAARLGARRPFLHAWRLVFRHPVTGRTIEITEPLPMDLEHVLDAARGDQPEPGDTGQAASESSR
jgi:23S rRNA pseudouridine1911/1915/1917 synthase